MDKNAVLIPDVKWDDDGIEIDPSDAIEADGYVEHETAEPAEEYVDADTQLAPTAPAQTETVQRYTTKTPAAPPAPTETVERVTPKTPAAPTPPAVVVPPPADYTGVKIAGAAIGAFLLGCLTGHLFTRRTKNPGRRRRRRGR